MGHVVVVNQFVPDDDLPVFVFSYTRSNYDGHGHRVVDRADPVRLYVCVVVRLVLPILLDNEGATD